MTRPDLRHVDTWVFDLDNTLYPADIDLFAQVDRRMGEFIARLLDISYDEARVLQKRYYAEHGTTLSGLIRRHRIEPREFLDFVHDIDVGAVKPSPELDDLLTGLDGRKIVYTNGSLAHAERVIAALEVGRHFGDIYDIEASAYVPKHERKAFERFLDKTAIAPASSAMFDDVAKNLAPAGAAGMTTVWIRTRRDWGVPREFLDREEFDTSFVHHQADDLVSFLKAMRHKGSPVAAPGG